MPGRRILVVSWAVFRAVAFILAAAALLFLLQRVDHGFPAIARRIADGPVAALLPVLAVHAILAAAVLLLTLVFRGRRDAFRWSGIPFDRGGVRRLAIGAASGAVGMAVVVGVIAAFGSFVVLGWKNGIATGMAVALVCVATYLLVGLLEEIWFRGYAVSVLERNAGFGFAASLTSLLFGAAHGFNPGEGWASEAIIVLAGLFLCLLRRATGSLWHGIGLHAGFDYAQGVVFSGPDSGVDLPAEHLLLVRVRGPDWLTGGAAGYENSLVCLLVMLVLMSGPLVLLLRKPAATVRPGGGPLSRLASDC